MTAPGEEGVVRRSPRRVGPACVPDEGGRCGICGDEGRTARVLEVLQGEPTARVRIAGRAGEEAEVTEVALDLLDEVAPGDRIVVHMGFGIAVVREGDDGRTPGGARLPGRRPRERSPGPPDARTPEGGTQ